MWSLLDFPRRHCCWIIYLFIYTQVLTPRGRNCFSLPTTPLPWSRVAKRPLHFFLVPGTVCSESCEWEVPGKLWVLHSLGYLLPTAASPGFPRSAGIQIRNNSPADEWVVGPQRSRLEKLSGAPARSPSRPPRPEGASGLLRPGVPKIIRGSRFPNTGPWIQPSYPRVRWGGAHGGSPRARVFGGNF